MALKDKLKELQKVDSNPHSKASKAIGLAKRYLKNIAFTAVLFQGAHLAYVNTPMDLPSLETSAVALNTAINKNQHIKYPSLLERVPIFIERSTPLFHGQTNHPLSVDEIALIKRRINIVTNSKENIQKIHHYIDSLNTIPSGRETLRNICVGTRYGISKEWADKANAKGFANVSDNLVVLNEGGDDTLTGTFAHEITHIIQGLSNPHLSFESTYKNNKMKEAVAGSLSTQIGCEFSDNNMFTSFHTNYNSSGFAFSKESKSYRHYKTRKSDLEKTTQDSDIPFVDGLSAQQKQEARKLFIEQVTAHDVRANYIKDFLEGNPDSQVMDDTYSTYNKQAIRIAASQFIDRGATVHTFTSNQTDPYFEAEIQKFLPNQQINIYVPEQVKAISQKLDEGGHSISQTQEYMAQVIKSTNADTFIVEKPFTPTQSKTMVQIKKMGQSR